MSKRKLIAKFTKPMLNDMAATGSTFKQINVGRGWKRNSERKPLPIHCGRRSGTKVG
ncbi:MAG: hypothetical protein ACTS6H_01325 [Candidatus Hodgkinia cicadicola]